MSRTPRRSRPERPAGGGARVPAATAATVAACLALLASPATGAAASGLRAAGPAGPTAGADTSGADSGPRALLRRAQERYRQLGSLRAHFSERVQVPLLERERTGEGTWYQKGNGLFKLDYSDPPNDVIVSDGTHVWTYYPSSQPGQVTRTALERSSRGREMVDLMGRIFREARRGYRAEFAGTETVGGVETRHVVLTPTGGDAPYSRVELWIAPTDHLVRKFDVTEENETVRTVTLTDLEPNARIADSVFHFDVPEGAEVFSG